MHEQSTSSMSIDSYKDTNMGMPFFLIADKHSWHALLEAYFAFAIGIAWNIVCMRSNHFSSGEMQTKGCYAWILVLFVMLDIVAK